MPLASRLRADQQCYPAVGIEIQRRGFRAVVAAGLDIRRNADASQAAGASGLRRAFVKALPISKLLGTSERACEIAEMVDLSGWSFVRQRLRLDEISATYGIGRNSEIVCCCIDNTFN